MTNVKKTPKWQKTDAEMAAKATAETGEATDPMY